MTEHGIGWAITQVKQHHHVRRAGWNGKGMFLRIAVQGTWIEVMPDKSEREYTMGPFVLLRTADGNEIPWTCSQSDLLATDWEFTD